MTEAAEQTSAVEDVPGLQPYRPSQKGPVLAGQLRQFTSPQQPQGPLSTEVQGLNTDLDELRAVASKLHEALFGSDREGVGYQTPTDAGGVAGGIKTAKTKIAAIKEQLTRITAKV